MKRLILFIVLSGLIVQIYAQKSTIGFQHLKPADGLSQGHVLCMMQDTEGYIWIGTYYGLNRYDGYSFKLFSKKPNDTTSIVNDVIYSLFEDSEGKIWVGTAGGLDIFDKETETFTHIPPYQPNGFSGGQIKKIIQDKDGNIWAGTMNGGLNKIEHKTGQISVFKTSNKKQNALKSNTISDLHIDNSGNLWIATGGGGISVMNIVDNEIKTYSQHQGALPSDDISCVFGDNEGEIWIGDKKGNLSKYNSKKDHFTTYNILSEEFKNQAVIITDISQDYTGNILVATLGAGLISYDPQSNTSKAYLHNNYDDLTISSNEAYSLIVDRTGTVFVGTYGRGISKYSPFNNKFKTHYISARDDKEGDMNSYTSCVEDAKDRLIIGSYYGFYIYDKETWKYKHIVPGKTYAENKILSMAIAPDSTIWMGTNKGIHRYDKNFNKIRTYNLLNDGLEHPVYEIYFDDKNNLWAGLFVVEGLFKVPENEWRNRAKEKLTYNAYKTKDDSTSISGNQIWSIKQDKKLNLWVGTNQGICKYNYDKNNFTRYNITELSKTLAFDYKGNMWIATRGDGVFHYNLKTGKKEHYTREEGLCQNFVFGIIIDSEQNLWFTTEDGLSKFYPDTKTFRNYDILDGLPHNQFDDRSEKKLKNGEVYMGTSKGFMVFKPELIKDDTSKAHVVLTGLKISSQNVEYNFSLKEKNRINRPIGRISKVELYPGEKDFSFEFAALHYSAPQKIKYKYKLEGFDEDWISTDSKNRNVRYTNLDGGTYLFKVLATNGDGVWNDTPLVIEVIIYPPFYKTLLFQLLIILTISLIFFVIFRWRIISIRKRNIILETLVNERTRQLTEKNELLNKNAQKLYKTNTLLETKQRDIETQKEELATQRDKLVELNAVKDKLFSIIAHDLKNPFNAIIGFSDLVLTKYDKHDDNKRKSLVDMINQSAKTAFHLLENLLEWSRSQQGSIKFNPEAVPLSELIEIAVSQVKGFATSKEITISVIQKGLEVELEVDKNMIITVLRNLLSNAVKFSNRKKPIIVEANSYNESFVKVSIIDQGIGISSDVIKDLFKVHKNISHVGTDGEKGTGLGLIICKEFIATHNGKIWVESELEKGTTFYFTLPKNR